MSPPHQRIGPASQSSVALLPVSASSAFRARLGHPAQRAGGLSPGLAREGIARRELLEDVGGRAAELGYVGQFYTSNGISNEIAYVYLATAVACPDCSWSGSWARLNPRPRSVR
jgi:hypothetical protein